MYYGWVMVVLAAAAMSATLPGRTIGLETLTGPVLADPRFGLDAAALSWFHFGAAVLGAVLCLPVGRLIDRVGVRPVAAVVAGGLGLAVLGLTAAADRPTFFLALTLVRGLGQAALSLVALAMVGKWFTRRLGGVMGLFAVLITFGLIGGYMGLKEAVAAVGWREAWAGMGYALLLGLAPAALLFARSTPEAAGVAADDPGDATPARPPLDLPWRVAVRTWAFWVVTLTASLLNLFLSAVTLFAEPLLVARGFPAESTRPTTELMLGLMTFVGLPVNLLSGWLVTRVPLGRLTAVGAVALAAAALLFPLVRDGATAAGFGAVLGAAGGVLTVVFFAAYGVGYGRAKLGVIVASAQVATVLASAAGPVLLTECGDRLGSYDPLFVTTGVTALLLAGVGWFTRLPTEPDRTGGV